LTGIPARSPGQHICDRVLQFPAVAGMPNDNVLGKFLVRSSIGL
jgi:hypothetical protein